MISGKIGIEFITRNGVMEWREVYHIESQQKICGPWQQTAPELGFSAPVESNDRRGIERLQQALRAKVGQTLIEAGQFRLAERLNLRPSAL